MSYYIMEKLKEIDAKLDHVILAVADIARQTRGGLTPEETKQLTLRLTAHAHQLESITRNPLPEYLPRSIPMVPADLAAVLTQIDKDTDAVAVTVKSLDALISTSMSPADVQTVKTTLAAVATRLEATAADPNVPVPPAPPPAPVTKTK